MLFIADSHYRPRDLSLDKILCGCEPQGDRVLHRIHYYMILRDLLFSIFNIFLILLNKSLIPDPFLIWAETLETPLQAWRWKCQVPAASCKGKNGGGGSQRHGQWGLNLKLGES